MKPAICERCAFAESVERGHHRCFQMTIYARIIDITCYVKTLSLDIYGGLRLTSTSRVDLRIEDQEKL
jgi:hypothetical protein